MTGTPSFQSYRMLFALGSNGSGQLGIGNTNDVSEAQQCIFQSDESDPPGTPVRISTGGNHTLVLFDSGRLFFAGSNSNGQAGIKSRVSAAAESLDLHTVFTEIEFSAGFQKIKLCSATWEASVIVTSDDKVYAFGSGPKGELGTGVDISRNTERLPNFPPIGTSIIDIASGVRHVVVVLSNGDVYGWGNGRKGQLGEPVGTIRAPRKFNEIKFMRRATCGTEFTYLVGDPSEGRHVVLGSDKWGVRSKSPTYMQDWENIGSSWGSITTLTSAGKLVAWGRNDRGQLAPSGLATSDIVEQVAVGSEHALALSRSGQVLAWGWGEHGNCGPEVDNEGNVKGGWRTLSINSINANALVVGIAAGCATSFVWTTFEPHS